MVKRLLITLAAALVLAPGAFAKGGNYAFDGGTRVQQAQVKAALDASTFDFSVVPGQVTIHIARGADSRSTPGQIWLDGSLLDSGRLSWGVVQHEYAHQVDFSVLDDAGRAVLAKALGGDAWCFGAAHVRLTCERFADLVAWAYWTAPDNVMKPAGATDEGGQMAPAAFRALVSSLLPAPAVRFLTSVSTQRHPRKR
jgi:hypothetical protein